MLGTSKVSSQPQLNEIIRVNVPIHKLNEILKAINGSNVNNDKSLINIWVERTHFEREEDMDEDDSVRDGFDEEGLP
ncbi:hypothetical protein LIER_16918 [Lithospermum erythrorhizon]|uniref:Uncharacterized protein n=1 Tax=Lithospermum erythrorhizon TaxID=34254 RepID=A0AAV3Q8E9_LITER